MEKQQRQINLLDLEHSAFNSLRTGEKPGWRKGGRRAGTTLEG